jgi:site-specific DNA-methyltransferase (adenine-specific)
MIRPYYEKDEITIYHGDLLDVLPQSPETSVECVVTDPPYGIGFMEKEWDHGVPGPAYWEAIARVCKPGASVLAFGGTRTHHRLTCAIEDAGLEIRDCLMWLYGQGFPKAPDVGKLIDKAARGVPQGGPDRTSPNHGKYKGGCSGDHPKGRGFGAGPGAFMKDRGQPSDRSLVKEAQPWQGWANALKPAWEPIVLAMKPVDGTIVHNAAMWGVAGLNIDAGRIGTDDQSKGRWPANLLLDERAAQQLDVQTGTLTSGKMKAGQHRKASKGKGGYHNDMPDEATASDTYGDSGGASRFFYCSKASKSEKGPSNDHPTVKPLDLMKYLLTLVSTPTGGVILDPFAGSGTTALAAKQLGRRCICIELDKHNCDIAVARLEGRQ